MVDIVDIANKLRKDPSEKNWKSLAAVLKRGDVAYYRTFFGKGKLSSTQDLRKSHVKLYDKKKKEVAEIPIFVGKGRGIEGATIYLKGLSILNG